MNEEVGVKKELKRVGILTAILAAILVAIWLIDNKTGLVLRLGQGLSRLAHFE